MITLSFYFDKKIISLARSEKFMRDSGYYYNSKYDDDGKHRIFYIMNEDNKDYFGGKIEVRQIRHGIISFVQYKKKDKKEVEVEIR